MNKNIDSNYIIGFVIFIIFALLGGNIFWYIMAGIAFIAAIIFLTRLNHQNPNFKIQNQNRGTSYMSRQNALESVRLYLAPHKSIWQDLRVSNKYCTLRLGVDGQTITATEKNDKAAYRKFRIAECRSHTMQELWDMFCLNFDHLTSYDGLLELCNIFRAVYIEERIGMTPSASLWQGDTATYNKTSETTDQQEKLDINNASEVEITALPGISIVLSKKLIKKREEIGGFKKIEDVFLFLKLKPHMESQLRNLICVNKMKGSVKIQRTSERSVDL